MNGPIEARPTLGEAIDTGFEAVKTERARAAVLAGGSQSEEALRRMVEDLGADAVLLPYNTPASELEHLDFVIGSGGASSVHDHDAPQLDPQILEPDFRPLFIGVCYSAQNMVHMTGGTVTKSGGQGEKGSYGPLQVTVVDDRAEGGFTKIQTAPMFHSNGDHVKPEDLPEGRFVVTAMTGEHVAAAIDIHTGNILFQPHPELSEALGYGVIRNVLKARNINLQPRPEDLFQRMVDEINEKAGDGETDLVIGLSGGIDSNMVAEAVIKSKVPRNRIHVLALDMGVYRTENGVSEMDIVVQRFEERTGIKPILRHVSIDEISELPVELFDENGVSQGLHRLCDHADSEMKRLIFSQWYGNQFSDTIDSLELDPNKTQYVQGTLYPDVIESIGKGKVKTHHNLGPFFVRLEKNNQIINPAQRYFKNDMRQMGKVQGLTQAEYDRQPFPGPGLIPRIVCYNGELFLPQNPQDKWEQAKEIVGDEFGVFLGGFRTVGQKGDKRSYAWPIMLTGEEDWERMEHLMFELSGQMPDTINRVYHLTGDRVEGFSAHDNMTTTVINRESVTQLQEIDDQAMRILESTGALDLSVTDQVPIGLLPTAFSEGNTSDRTAFFRPFKTPKVASFLNGKAVYPTDERAVAEAYEQFVPMALATAGIKRVAYDVTHKSPGSTEAE